MIATVKDYHPRQTKGWGCFLSGGTDSSSIVSILAREAGRGAAAFPSGSPRRATTS